VDQRRDDAAFAAAVAAFDQVAAVRARVVAAVKVEAQRRIYSVVPQWRQANLTARGVVLADKGRGSWSPAELAEWEAGEAIWQRVTALRDASNAIEAALAALGDWREIEALDVAARPEWPE
jgi:hypothetical protein